MANHKTEIVKIYCDMKDIVTFDLAKKLKEKGFREKCLYRGDHFTILGSIGHCFYAIQHLFQGNRSQNCPQYCQYL